MYKRHYLFLILATISLIANSDPVDSVLVKQISKSYMSKRSTSKNVKSFKAHKFKGKNSFYVTNFQEGGFVVVSADDRMEPILAYSTKGEIDLNSLNPSLEFWFKSYDIEIDSLLRSKSSTRKNSWEAIKKESNSLKKATTSSEEFYLMTSEWNQSPYYNSLVEDGGSGTSCSGGKCAAGCVAIAMAQIMRYWRHPIHSTYADYDWCNMPDFLSWNSTSTQVNAVAKLIADCGKKAKMDYCSSNCSSGASSSDARDALASFGFNGADYIRKIWHESQWRNIIRDEIDWGRPILYGGYKGTFGNGGHQWVIDGYDRNNDRIFHFNWGWGGAEDGFYYLSDGNPYNNWMDAIIGIYPSWYIQCDNVLDIGFYTNDYIQQYINIYGYPPPNQAIINHVYNPPISGTITSASTNYSEGYRTIPVGATANYIAYNTVELKAGFIAEAGSNFNAKIIPCPSNCSMSLKSITVNNEVVEIKSSYQILNDSILNNKKELKLSTENHNWDLNSYPNPFNESTRVIYSIANNVRFSIVVTDLMGKVVHSLNGYLPIGQYQLDYDFSNLKSGIYICKFQSAVFSKSIKLVKE